MSIVRHLWHSNIDTPAWQRKAQELFHSCLDNDEETLVKSARLIDLLASIYATKRMDILLGTVRNQFAFNFVLDISVSMAQLSENLVQRQYTYKCIRFTRRRRQWRSSTAFWRCLFQAAYFAGVVCRRKE